MAMITPTVDSVGDVALTNSIIDKSITEIQDDLVTDIREHAFYNCTALRKAVFGSVSDVADRAFDGCTALTIVDFHTSTPIGDYVFNNCPALTALILRGATVCHAVSGTLQNSGIANGNGYIYVPAALLDAYKAHSAWGRYSSQIRAIEEYPWVIEPYSWEAVAKNIETGSYKKLYAIGDKIPLDMGTEGLINMQIAAFDADVLADGSGTAAISWLGKELLNTARRANPARAKNDDGTYQVGTGGIGGWEHCEMRAYLQNTIAPMIPATAANLIQTVSKTQKSFKDLYSSSSQTTSDNVWIPNVNEFSGGIYQSLFPDNTSLKKFNPGGVMGAKWMLREANSSMGYRSVNATGSINSDNADTDMYICLGFCTGRTPA